MLVRCKVESCFSLEALQSVSEPEQYLFAIGLKMDASLTAFHLQGTAQKTWNVSWCAVPIVKSVEWSDTAPCKSYFAGWAMAFCCGWQSLWFAGPGCSFDFCRSRGVFTCLYRCKHVGTAQSSFLRVGLFWRMFQKKTKHRYLQYVQVVRLQLETELRWVGVFVQRCVCLKREGSNCIPFACQSKKYVAIDLRTALLSQPFGAYWASGMLLRTWVIWLLHYTLRHLTYSQT